MRKWPIILLLALFALFSCSTEQVEPSRLDLSIKTVEVPYYGDEVCVSVDCDMKCKFSASSSWLSVRDSVSNDGKQLFCIKIPFTDTYQSRSDTLKVSAGSMVKSLPVVQDGLSSATSPSSVVFGSTPVAFTLDSPLPWTARAISTKSQITWFEMQPVSGKAGKSIIKVIPKEDNLDENDRNAHIEISIGANKIILLATQKKKASIILDADKIDVSNKETIFDVHTQSNIDYAVSIDPECSSWLSQSEVKGLRTDKFSFCCKANSSENPRKGKIVFTGSGIEEILTVYQAERDMICVEGNNVELPSGEGTKTLSVRANVRFETFFEDAQDWVSVADNLSDVVDKVTLKFKQNDGYDPRRCTLVLKDINSSLSQRVEVVQHQHNVILLNDAEITLSNKAQTVSVPVSSNTEYKLEILNGSSWITPAGKTKGLTENTESFSILANDSDSLRSATIRFEGEMCSEILKLVQDRSDYVFLGSGAKDAEFFGGPVSVEYESNVDVALSIGCQWIKEDIDKGVKGVKSLRLEANTSHSVRYSSIIFKGKDCRAADTLFVFQAGHPLYSFLDCKYPAFFNVSGREWGYAIQSSQISIRLGKDSYSFVLVWPEKETFIELGNLPYEPVSGDRFLLERTMFGSINGSDVNSLVTDEVAATIWQVDDKFVWIKSKAESYIVKRASKI